MASNPYQTPKTFEPLPETRTYPGQLASRWKRFAGNLIDGFLVAIAVLPFYVGLILAYSSIDPQYLDRPETIMSTVIETAVFLVLFAALFIAINGYLLANRGQTVGKLLLKMKIVSDDGRLVPLSSLLLKRYVWVWVMQMLPFVGSIGNIINAIAIFRENKKCIHDDIAKTKVIDVTHMPM